MNAQIISAALVTGALYALMAVSLNLIYGTMRLLNIAHGDLTMVGAYVVYWLLALWGLPPLLGLVAGTLLSAALGVLVYKGLFERVFRNTRRLDRVESNSLLVFFGISVILENVASLWFSGTPRGFDYYNRVIRFADVALVEGRLVALIVAVVAVVAVVLFFRLSIWGMAIRALIQNRDASALMGIDIDRVFILSSALGFGLAGLTGGLVSMYVTITPFMGTGFTMAAFVIIILGGLGNLVGSVLGGILLGVLETVGVSLAGPNYRSILIYGVFIVIMVWRPQGLFGSKLKSA